LVWAVGLKKDRLWVKLVHNSIWIAVSSPGCLWVWKAILKVRDKHLVDVDSGQCRWIAPRSQAVTVQLVYVALRGTPDRLAWWKLAWSQHIPLRKGFIL
ncbi:hypothetical protein Dimus_014792, partial [Dionaea muscipula]